MSSLAHRFASIAISFALPLTSVPVSATHKPSLHQQSAPARRERNSLRLALPEHDLGTCSTPRSNTDRQPTPNSYGSVELDSPTLISTTPITHIPVGEHPRGVVFSPDGALAYVSHEKEPTIKVVRVSDHTVIQTLVLGEPTQDYNLLGLDVTPDGQYLYVAWRDNSVVVPIRTSDMTALDAIPVSLHPMGLSIDSDGSHVYVAGKGGVDAIETSTNTIVDHIDAPAGELLYAIEVSPDDTELYINGGAHNKLYVISISTFTTTASIPVGPGPHHDLDVAPDGSVVYTSASQYRVGGGDLDIVRLSDGHVEEVHIGGGVSGVAVTPDGHYVYVSAYGTNRVSVVSTSDNSVVEHIAVGSRPDGIIDIDPLGTFLYVPNNESNTVSVIAVRGSSSDTTPPAAIDDLDATPGNLPGTVELTWTAPGDDGHSGAASTYVVKYSTMPILSEEDWTLAFHLEGAPPPLAAGSVQSMTVSLWPGRPRYFAVKAQDEVPNTSALSNLASTTPPGNLITDINSQLERDPSTILGQRVTVLAIPVRTDDLTAGVGHYGAVIEIKHFYDSMKHMLLTKGGLGSFMAVAKALFLGVALGNWLQMRSQVLWGLHETEYSGDPAGLDPTLLVWDPLTPLMNHGVPHVVTGIVRKKTYYDILAVRDDYFYYLEVDHSENIDMQVPSATHSHFTIPRDYTYHNWKDIWASYEDRVCTIGMVTERYPLDGYHYVRIQLMERLGDDLAVRVPAAKPTPDMWAGMALFCGTKQFSSACDLYPGWLPICKYLDTTIGQGGVQPLQGTSSIIEQHERRPTTILGIEIGSPADIHVYDPDGNHLGAVYDAHGRMISIEDQIPDAEYYYSPDDAPESVSIANPTQGTYTVTIRGTATGLYTQTIRIYDSAGGQTFTSTLTAEPISAGQEKTTIVNEIPRAPTGLRAHVENDAVNLDWDHNTESDLAGYNVYRRARLNGTYHKISDSIIPVSSYTDNSLDEHIACYYYVTAVDEDHNESGHLTPVSNWRFVYLPVTLRAR